MYQIWSFGLKVNHLATPPRPFEEKLGPFWTPDEKKLKLVFLQICGLAC
jgi:hypothetical protein